MTFVAAQRKLFPASKKAFCCRSNPSLLGPAYIFLWWSLYAFLAGLHLYKMYSIRTYRDYVDFKVPNSEVAFKNGVSLAIE